MVSDCSQPTRCSAGLGWPMSLRSPTRTPVAVDDSYGSAGGANWYVFGGTRAAAPIIAGVYALSGNTSGANGIPASLAYGAPAVGRLS
jgi:hypothetical protein